MAKKKVSCNDIQALIARLFKNYGSRPEYGTVDAVVARIKQDVPSITREIVEDSVFAFIHQGANEAKVKVEKTLTRLIKDAEKNSALRQRLEAGQKALQSKDFSAYTPAASAKRATTATQLEAAVDEIESKIAKEIAASRKASKPVLDRKSRIMAGIASRSAGGKTPNRLIQMLAKELVGDVDTRDQLVDAVHAEIEGMVPPGWTRSDTMNAISGYGDFKKLSDDALSVKLRDFKGQLQEVGKLEDMIQRGEPPKKTGVQRQAPSDEKRRLAQEVADTKKRLGIKTTDPESQLQSTLDAIKTRLKNAIADIENQIKTGKRVKRTTNPPPTDNVVVAMKAKLDSLKKALDALVGPDLGPRKAIIQRRIEQLTKLIADRDVSTGRKPKEIGPKEADVALRDELNRQLLSMRHLANQPVKLRSAIEEVEYQIAYRTKAAKVEARESTPEIVALKEHLKMLKRIESYVTQSENLRTLIDALKTGEYQEVKKVVREETQRESDARFERDLLRKEADILIAANAPKTLFGKLYDEINNVARGLLTFGDASVVLGQLFAYSTAHPVRGLQLIRQSLEVLLATPKMADIKAAYEKDGMLSMLKKLWTSGNEQSDKKIEKLENEIKESPKYQLMVAAGLPLTINAQEELFLSKVLGIVPTFNRSANAYRVINIARAALFETMVDALPVESGKVTLEEAKHIADTIGVLTGRGNWMKSVQNLHRSFFAAKYIFARFSFLTGYRVWGPAPSMRVRQAAAHELGRYYLAAGLMMLFSKMMGGEVEDDPRSSDLGRITIFDRRFDILIGREFVVAATQFLTNEKVKAGSSKVSKSRKFEVLGNFFKAKLAPAPSLLWERSDGTNFMGEKVTLGESVANRLMPIGPRGIAETFETDESNAMKIVASALNFFGIRTRNYD